MPTSLNQYPKFEKHSWLQKPRRHVTPFKTNDYCNKSITKDNRTGLDIELDNSGPMSARINLRYLRLTSTNWARMNDEIGRMIGGWIKPEDKKTFWGGVVNVLSVGHWRTVPMPAFLSNLNNHRSTSNVTKAFRSALSEEKLRTQGWYPVPGQWTLFLSTLRVGKILKTDAGRDYFL